MKVWLTSLALLTGLAACSEQRQRPVGDPVRYQVQTAQGLQQRLDALTVQLAQDFQKFKKVESIAFAHQFPLDVNNRQSLNQHLVSITALKPRKIAYCDMMNSYFADMYRLGHYNLELVDDIKLPNANRSE